MKFSRYFRLAIIAAIAVSCQHKADPDNNSQAPVKADFKEATVFEVSESRQFHLMAGSPDGKLVIGTNFVTSKPSVYDIAAEKFSEISGLEKGGDPFYINNKGVVVGQALVDDLEYLQYGFVAENNAARLLYYDDSIVEEEDMFNPGQMIKSAKEKGSAAYAITEDGKTIAGFYLDGWYAHACIWKAPFTSKSDRIDLPEPTTEQCGFTVNGSEARWMSTDGSVIAGFLMDDASTWPLIVWTRQADGTYKLNVTCLAYYHPFDWEKEGKLAQYMTFAVSSLSPNGKYVGLTLKAYSDSFTEPDVTARLNLTTNELEILDGDYLVPNAISDDGTVVGNIQGGGGMIGPLSTKADTIEGAAIWRGGEKSAVSLSSMIGDTALSGLYDTALVYISADNSVAAGQAVTADNYDFTGFIVK